MASARRSRLLRTLHAALGAAARSIRRAWQPAPPAPPPSALVINGDCLAPVLPLTQDVNVVFRSVDELYFGIADGEVAVAETVTGRDLSDFGLVQLASYPRPTASLVGAIVAYLDYHGVPAINMTGIGVPTKLVQYVRFALDGLPVPPTVYLTRAALLESFPVLARELELPFVLKALSGSNGRHNYLISDERELAERLSALERCDHTYLVQRLVPNDTTYRMLVLGGVSSIVIRRTWAPGSHLTNTSRGGIGTLVEPGECDPYAVQIALDAAHLLGNEVVGINVIQDWTTGKWYLLGADPNPALASGVFVAEKLVAYAAYLRRRLLDSTEQDRWSILYPRRTMGFPGPSTTWR